MGALTKRLALRLDKATWGELRVLVEEADTAGIGDDEELDLLWDGTDDEPILVGIEPQLASK